MRAAPIALPPAAAPANTANGAAVDFSALGETDFKSGNYSTAANDWRHAMLDDSKNPVLVLLYGQAQFANGKYDEAAGTVQYGLRQLSEDQWGVVVSHYAELYRGNQDYTDQLRALEAAAKKPETDSPAVRFLLGYHYGYLGYPKDAIAELDKALASVPQDEIAARLRAIMVSKLPVDQQSAFAPKTPPDAKAQPETKDK